GADLSTVPAAGGLNLLAKLFGGVRVRTRGPGDWFGCEHRQSPLGSVRPEADARLPRILVTSSVPLGHKRVAGCAHEISDRFQELRAPLCSRSLALPDPLHDRREHGA